MVKVVVLDVDGTLMDTNYLHTEAWARAFERAGHRVPRVRLHREVGKGAGLLIQEFVDDEETLEKIQGFHTEVYEELQEYGHPLPGAKELISSLKERGYGVWFVTSAKDEELEHHMQELEAEGSVDGVVNSSAVENPKPAPTSSRRPCEEPGRLRTRPSPSVMRSGTSRLPGRPAYAPSPSSPAAPMTRGPSKRLERWPSTKTAPRSLTPTSLSSAGLA